VWVGDPWHRYFAVTTGE